MTGLWLDTGTLRVRHDLPIPVPGEGEALVCVALAGICGTDHELLGGYADFRGIPGHEMVGIVETGPSELAGRRVVADINVGCGACRLCRQVGPSHCAERTVMGIRGRSGAFADYVALPIANLHTVPDDVATDVAVFAEPLAAALRAREQLSDVGARDVLVIGDGRLGQLVCRALVIDGTRVHVVGRHPRKLGLLRDHGARVLDESEVADAAFEAVVECSGRPGGYATARRAVRPRGTIVLKTTRAGEPASVDPTGLVVDEVRLLGSRCGSVARAVTSMQRQDLGLEDLIDARYPLTRGNEAMQRSRRPDSLKVLLTPSGSD